MISFEARDTRYRSRKNAFLMWFPPVLVLLLILALSLTPGSLYPEHPEIYNIAVHFLEFTLLAYFLARALAESRDRGPLGIFVLAVAPSALTGIITELLQFMVPHRTFGVMDMLVDISGALFGTSLYLFLMKMRAAGGPEKGNLPDTEDA